MGLVGDDPPIAKSDGQVRLGMLSPAGIIHTCPCASDLFMVERLAIRRIAYRRASRTALIATKKVVYTLASDFFGGIPRYEDL